MDLIQRWSDNKRYCTLHFDTSLIDRYLDSRSQKCKKAETSVPIISKFSIDLNGIWCTVET